MVPRRLRVQRAPCAAGTRPARRCSRRCRDHIVARTAVFCLRKSRRRRSRRCADRAPLDHEPRPLVGGALGGGGGRSGADTDTARRRARGGAGQGAATAPPPPRRRARHRSARQLALSSTSCSWPITFSGRAIQRRLGPTASSARPCAPTAAVLRVRLRIEQRSRQETPMNHQKRSRGRTAPQRR